MTQFKGETQRDGQITPEYSDYLRRTYCMLHGNYRDMCPLCVDEKRQQFGRLTIRRWELDQEYRALNKSREH